MQNIKAIVIGAILLAIGGGLLSGVDLGGGTLYWVTWVFTGFGVAMFANGLYQAFGAGSVGADANEAYQHDSTARLIMQCTLIVAQADGPLSDEELALVTDIGSEVAQQKLDPESIRRIAAVVDNRGEAILEEIRAEGKMLNLDERRTIIDACLLVLKLNKEGDARVTHSVGVIAAQLGFSEIEVGAMVVEALKEQQN